MSSFCSRRWGTSSLMTPSLRSAMRARRSAESVSCRSEGPPGREPTRCCPRDRSRRHARGGALDSLRVKGAHPLGVRAQRLRRLRQVVETRQCRDSQDPLVGVVTLSSMAFRSPDKHEARRPPRRCDGLCTRIGGVSRPVALAADAAVVSAATSAPASGALSFRLLVPLRRIDGGRRRRFAGGSWFAGWRCRWLLPNHEIGHDLLPTLLPVVRDHDRALRDESRPDD
jgi:hypothetical protein